MPYEQSIDNPGLGPGGTYGTPQETPSWYVPAGLAAGALLGYGALRGIGKGISRFGQKHISDPFRQGAREATPAYKFRNHTAAEEMPWIEGFAKKSNVQERPLLKVAYALGAQAAIQAFQKQARDADLSDPGHLSTALLSPLGLGFVPAAITAKEGKGFRDAAMAGLGGAVGGVGGSAVGGLGGLTVGTLLGALAKRPDIGAAIGGIGGLYGGGVLGAGYGGHKGLSMAREDDWTGPK